jgi:ribose transport system substrate-binding protein
MRTDQGRPITRFAGGAAILLAAGALAAGCGSATSPTGGGGVKATSADETQAIGTKGKVADLGTINALCGSKPITVGLADGFGGNSWRKISRMNFELEAAKCSNIKKVLYTDGQNNPQKAISDINGLVAQGVNVLVIFPDAAEAVLPAIRKATQAGVKVVPYVSSPGGVPGKDYVDFVAEDVVGEGRTMANWMVKALHGKGSVVFLGGIAGNSYSNNVGKGIEQVIAANPGMKLLAGPVATDWDPSKTQKVVAGLLTKYKQIDGVLSDYGGGSVGGIRAFMAAGRKLVPWAANDANEFSCLYEQYKTANPGFQIATVSSRNWMSRVALRKGVAAAQGTKDAEPSILELPLNEDSIAGGKLAPKCDKSLPPDAILSGGLTTAQLKQLFR